MAQSVTVWHGFFRWLIGAASAFGIALAAHATESVRVVETQIVPTEMPARSSTSRALHLSLYVFRDGRWSGQEIAPAIQQALRLIGQCGIAAEKVELRVLEAPRRYRFYSTPVSRELLRAFTASKPAIFFVDDTLSRPAFDAETIGVSNASTRPELANTIWVAYGARDLPLALAHELVHLLSDNGTHSDGPHNLMRDETAAENALLTPAQCERLRERGTANGMLERTR